MMACETWVPKLFAPLEGEHPRSGVCQPDKTSMRAILEVSDLCERVSRVSLRLSTFLLFLKYSLSGVLTHGLYSELA